ncbi:DRMBL-domain-containing protein [Hyaloscypha variabilis F]|uniref:DRMBL-domain-containing protein n=1 Tax=Hyaloscypha variabilis (strain UAMH 11265 / GT02V1 / F) TaxID=1149755 RepID=A0A2J6RTC0_HYAVF|nr:DRMBL-domain-containing protein [Hyaloscypha variabilis F]
MFRTPRSNANTNLSSSPIAPSTGRPPTPPNGTSTPHSLPPSTMTAKPLTPRPHSRSNVGLPVVSKSLGKNGGKGGGGGGKTPSKAPSRNNKSILNFFKKVEVEVEVESPGKGGEDESIFLSQGGSGGSNGVQRERERERGDREGGSAGFDAGFGFELDEEEEVDLYGAGDGYGEERFNERKGSVKRRKIDALQDEREIPDSEAEESQFSMFQVPSELVDVSASEDEGARACTPPPPAPEPKSKAKLKKKRRTGPFLSDSDEDDYVASQPLQHEAVLAEKRELRVRVAKQSEEENLLVETEPIDQEEIRENKPVVPQIESAVPLQKAWKRHTRVPVAEAQAKWEALQPKSDSNSSRASRASSSNEDSENATTPPPVIPALKKESTSVDEWGGFDEIDDFPDDVDEFADGEEGIERKWMEEQARLEAAELESGEAFNMLDDEPQQQLPDDQMTATCPMCEASLDGVTPEDATRHVNGCLDGNPIPLPTRIKPEPAEIKLMPPEAKNRFARKAAIARPGQANPFQLGSTDSAPSSAFSKLMSGKAEDAAWASAAASEQASRGKPAYQRTCPFYKIMPGFFICVDAFRYGAVQGCNAYFLSHFHSDHYVGLTASWCHGPIYCSKVTANLVKQQLRVDPKYVVPLEFEDRVEVPGTQGVAVTMIPANHCPGSSLFLFEKVVGKGTNLKMQRVLHCGDFRACPAHIAHPLLMPDIVCSITGKTKQQKIDVCYLDTTYLNPRYAFPSQEEVIKACADMCVSLKKERAEESDAWEVVKRERAGQGMTKFVNAAIKPEDDSIAMSISSASKTRGRLLVVCGTYSIGKELICLGIARALDCKIWAPPGKMRICAALEDEELMSRMTDDPKEAQIHMQMLMEIRAETLQEYLNSFKPHFSRIVGFRPSGWNYKPPNSRFTDSPSIQTILHSPNWQSSYSMAELIPQRGSTREASCFGVPYSEHSSFRELTMFVCALRIEKVVPTVNVGSAATRAKMKGWIERWMAERRKGGVVRVVEGKSGEVGVVSW